MRSFISLLVCSGILLFSFTQCDAPKNQDPMKKEYPVYQEPHRPQFHFSPASMWMNDPNGMAYYDGEYHLFYQHYPDSTVWGPMHWGHAISEDLVHWKHMPIALYPDSLGYIFSGSAVIDWNNTSGLGEPGRPPMIAIFTHHEPEGAAAEHNDFQYQSIAYSLDKGRSWIKYEGNPVLPNPGIKDFRDPKVFWHAPSGKWVMIFAAGDHIRIYNSANLIDWSYQSDFGQGIGGHGGVWECPDLFPLAIEGTDDSTWVMLLSINPGAPNGGSGTQYFLGDFDGKTFTMHSEFAEKVAADTHSGNPFWIDYGRDNYAGVTWSDIPAEDGRRIFLGWMSNWNYANVVPTERWRSAMTLPRVLSVRNTPAGQLLCTMPVEETGKIVRSKKDIPAQKVTASTELTALLESPSPMLQFNLDLSWEGQAQPEQISLIFSNTKGEVYRIGLKEDQWHTDRSNAGDTGFEDGFGGKAFAPRWIKDKTLSLEVWLDKASVEVFADEGATCLTDIFFPTEPFTKVSLEVEGGSVEITGGTVGKVKSIW